MERSSAGSYLVSAEGPPFRPLVQWIKTHSFIDIPMVILPSLQQLRFLCALASSAISAVLRKLCGHTIDAEAEGSGPRGTAGRHAV